MLTDVRRSEVKPPTDSCEKMAVIPIRWEMIRAARHEADPGHTENARNPGKIKFGTPFAKQRAECGKMLAAMKKD